jgi:SAM-dependent methyltransferase
MKIGTIKGFYRSEKLARKYISERFSRSLGLFQHRAQVEIINNIVRRHCIDRLLEIACGPARLTAEIRGFKQGVAIDASYPMLKIALERIKISGKWLIINGDAFNNFFKTQFQMVYTFRFIRHFRMTERMKLYENFHSLLEDGGLLIFDAAHYEKIVPVRRIENRGQRVIYDKIFKDVVELKNELDRAGFDILELKGTINHFYLQAVVSRTAHLLNAHEAGVKLIQVLESAPAGRALEWIVICQKR